MVDHSGVSLSINEWFEFQDGVLLQTLSGQATVYYRQLSKIIIKYASCQNFIILTLKSCTIRAI